MTWIKWLGRNESDEFNFKELKAILKCRRNPIIKKQKKPNYKMQENLKVFSLFSTF